MVFFFLFHELTSQWVHFINYCWTCKGACFLECGRKLEKHTDTGRSCKPRPGCCEKKNQIAAILIPTYVFDWIVWYYNNFKARVQNDLGFFFSTCEWTPVIVSPAYFQAKKKEKKALWFSTLTLLFSFFFLFNSFKMGKIQSLASSSLHLSWCDCHLSQWSLQFPHFDKATSRFSLPTEKF